MTADDKQAVRSGRTNLRVRAGCADQELENKRADLVQEPTKLMNTFDAIYTKSE